MTSIRGEWQGARKLRFPGNGRIETFLNRLASSRVNQETREFISVHPRLHGLALAGLKVIWFWHYQVQRDSCREGSRTCWQADHWRGGKVGPLGREMMKQLREQDTTRRFMERYESELP